MQVRKHCVKRKITFTFNLTRIAYDTTKVKNIFTVDCCGENCWMKIENMKTVFVENHRRYLPRPEPESPKSLFQIQKF